MSIFCQATGTIVSRREGDDGQSTVGRIVTADNQRVQFIIRRESLRESMRALPVGTPVALSGELKTFAREDGDRNLYVHREIKVSLLQPVQPSPEPSPGTFLQSIITRKAKP